MQRRSFLQALVGSVAAGRLILEASPAEVAAFGVQPAESLILQPRSVRPVTGLSPIDALQRRLVYSAEGEAIGVVMQATHSAPSVPVHAFGDTAEKYVLGDPRTMLIVEGIQPACIEWWRRIEITSRARI